MTTVEIIALTVTLAAIFVGLAGAMVLVGQRPTFWIGAIIAVFLRAWPTIKAYILRRNPPDIEAKMQECIRRGGEWDNFNKRCKQK